MKQKGKSYDSFYFMRDRSGWIPDSFHSHPSGRVDHWKIQSYGERNQFPSDCPGCFSVHPVGGSVKLTVIGEENVPTDVPVLYIGNHRSFFDVPLTYPRCPIRTGYIAKKEMEKVPLLSTWMKRLHCLFLDRNDLKQGLKTILTAIEKVKSGISICIFPEGTRNKNEDELDMLPFHEGSFKIAAKTNCPIIPMAISGSADIWENHFPRVKKTHVILEYGKPIYIDQLEKEDKKHLGAYTQNIIHEMLVKNKAQL